MVADKKADKNKQSVSSKRNGGNSGGAKAISLDRNKKIIIICVAVVACLAILLTMILSIRACTSGGKGTYADIFKNTTEVGYSAEYLGEVARKIPTEMKNGGLAQGYPTYGSTQNLTTEQKNAVILESWKLCSIDTRIGSNGYPKGTYNSMDADGNLYLNGEATGEKLYKHTASVGMYMGDVDDNEPAIVKNVTLRHRYSNSYSLTGMYAPAGEVIKIEMSEEDMDATGGILVHIGQALYNTKANNIWAAKGINRMPVILNSMKVNKSTATYDENTHTYTAYVGSFLGGPIYIHNTNVTVDVKISGGVRYTHFVLGYTTEDEFNENAKSSAPYFDLEVWDGGVLHSGPKKCAGISTYEEVQKAGVLWEKISLVSNYARKKREGIVFLYDPFVAAGAAVAFPGQQSVNCPAGWMSGSLKVDSYIRGGAWGNMHEYNHNFQGFGVGNGGEVTNNALNLVEYSWFTHISSARTLASYGGGGLSGWNCYTSATWAADQVINGRYSNGRQGLAIYANLLHNFGQETYIEMIRNSGGQSVDTWFNACMNTSHNDMTYYYKDLIGYNVSQSVLDNAKSKNYPLFIPMASVYQTGRSYVYDGEKVYFNTQQPFVIQYGEQFNIDLSRYTVDSASGIYQSGSVVIPERFSYTVKNVAAQDGQKINGTIEKVDDLHYVFKPNKEILSGKIIATLEVKDTQGVYTNIDDVDLILEFEQSHEMNKNVVQRTTYTYADGSGYTNAVEAYEAGYAGYANKTEGDNINRTQNSNTDVWYTNQAGDEVPKNGVVEIKGKLYVNEDGKYRIALRGRWNIALYIRINDEGEYKLAASSTSNTGNNINAVSTYYDIPDLKKGDWVYFKEVMITGQVGVQASFIGLGFNKFDDPMPILDANGDPMLDADGNTIETPEKITLSYAVGYREDYESVDKNFTSEYHYKRDYTYSYNYNYMYNDKQSLYGDMVNYVPWANNYELYAPEHLVDGDLNTFIHTQAISAQKPFIFTVDMGKEITANRMYVNTQSRQDYRYPKDFQLYGSLDGESFFKIGDFTDVPIISNNRIVVDFDLTTFRYYRMIITKSSNSLIIINRIDFMEHYEQLNGIKYSINNEMFEYSGKWSEQSTAASFGHVVVGQKGATVEFTFEGNRLALLSSSVFNRDFEVTIDGKVVSSDSFKNLDSDRTVVSFLSPELTQGKHTVKVKCKKKNSSIDSFVVWKAAETK
ncbi:MAG: M60 family metallopeptidase [Clostridia bacterium]|nr:M60 family metallopeptidase [Clostridia bacterium]